MSEVLKNEEKGGNSGGGENDDDIEANFRIS